MSPTPALGWMSPIPVILTCTQPLILPGFGSAHGSGVLRADPWILPNPAPSSFQVPWFEAIPIAVSNDISEQSLEEFRREVRNGWDVTWAVLAGLGCHLGCPWCWQGWDVDGLCLLRCLRGARST